MNKFKLSAKWIESNSPEKPGVYLVAVRHITGFGSYDLLYWDGENWINDVIPNVVAWSTPDNILNSIDADWPDGDKEIDKDFAEYRKKNKGKFKGDGFVEID